MKKRLIDVRELSEIRTGYIEGSEVAPLSTVAKASEQWDPSDELTLICRSGQRAGLARKQLQSRGFTRVHVLPGGIAQWKTEGKPLILPDGVAAEPSRFPAAALALGIVGLLLLARYVSPWFLLPVGFLATRVARTWWPRAMPCCTVPPDAITHSNKGE